MPRLTICYTERCWGRMNGRRPSRPAWRQRERARASGLRGYSRPFERMTSMPGLDCCACDLVVSKNVTVGICGSLNGSGSFLRCGRRVGWLNEACRWRHVEFGRYWLLQLLRYRQD